MTIPSRAQFTLIGGSIAAAALAAACLFPAAASARTTVKNFGHYDARGMLVAKERADGSLEKWVWDGLALVARGDRRFVNEPHVSGGVPVLEYRRDGAVFAHENDYLGNTLARHRLDAGNAATEHLATTFFGEKRWASADPAGFPDGPNNHYYAPVPTVGLDPLGLKTVLWVFVGRNGKDQNGNWDLEASYEDGSINRYFGDEFNSLADKMEYEDQVSIPSPEYLSDEDSFGYAFTNNLDFLANLSADEIYVTMHGIYSAGSTEWLSDGSLYSSSDINGMNSSIIDLHGCNHVDGTITASDAFSRLEPMFRDSLEL